MPGFPVQVFDIKLEDKFLCTSCQLVLKDPVQTQCGHRYCRSCLDVILREPGKHSCIVCKDEESTSDSTESLLTASQVYPDNAIKRELRGLPAKCLNQNCSWKGQLKDYEDHIQTCDYEEIKCIKSGCVERIPRGELAHHLETQCAMRVVQCQYCMEDVTSKELKAHHSVCPKYPLTCEFCHKKNIPREKYEDHINVTKGDCTKKVTTCTYRSIGCTERFEVEKSAEHHTKAQTKHIDLLFKVLTSFMDSIDKLRQDVNIPGMARNLSENQTKIDVIEDTVKVLEENIASVIRQKEQHKDGKFNVNGLEAKIENYTKTSEQLRNKVTVLETKVTTYEGIVAVLNSQIERDAQVVQILERQKTQDKELLEALERKIKAQDRIIALKDVALAEQDLRIQSLEMASYDGVLVWRISNFNQKRRDAISGRTTSIYSPCFYTSHHGYKMCTKVYLNGDGMGKGSHVSLSFVVMKGQFDALLRWPFRQKVTFMLFDQNNREHVIYAFRPDPSSHSFKRPTKNMNIASGCPLFMLISQLDSSGHAYVKDDTLFIKVIVDTSDIS